MEDVITKLISQMPSAVAIIIVVVYFIRYIRQRDIQEREREDKTLEVLTGLAVAINTVAKQQEAHHASMTDAVADMRNAVRRRKNDSRTTE